MITVHSILEFKILHDTGKVLCFIGNSHINKEMFRYFKQTRECEQILYEEILTKDQNWINDRQFIVTTASIYFRKLVVDGLSHFTPHYFSICGMQNHIGLDVVIGHGVLIHSFNTILDGVVVGDHTMLTTHSVFSHHSVIKDFCHIGSHSQILVATVGTGCYIAARASIVGTIDSPTIVADYCNFILGSMVTKTIESAGTYYGNRCLNHVTSLDKKID